MKHTPSLLRLLVRYEPETGKLFWLTRPRIFSRSDREHHRWNSRYAGTEAFKSWEGSMMADNEELVERVARAIDPDAFNNRIPKDGPKRIWAGRREQARVKARAAIEASGLEQLHKERDALLQDDPEQAYQIGLDDGHNSAVQDIDLLTGGDGEYRACLGPHDPDRNCPDAETMKARIAARFEQLHNRVERQRDLLGDAFDFLGGCDGASEIRDRILAARTGEHNG